MTLRRVLLPVIALALMATAVHAQPLVPAAIHEAIDQTGRALVIVGVRVPVFDAEGDLTPERRAAQRTLIRQTVDDVLAAAAPGVSVGHRFHTIPYFSAAVDARGLAALAALPDVGSIELDVPVPPLLAHSVPQIGAGGAWTAGARGSGWSVAVLDTGVETSHPLLAGRTIAESCVSNAGGQGAGTSLCPGGAARSTAAGSGVNCTGVTGCDHGTHVAGIAVGGGSLNGVAPAASLIAAQIFTRFDSVACGSSVNTPCLLTYTSDQIAALQHVLTLAGAGNANRVAAVNMSLGGGRYFAACDTGSHAAEKSAIDNLRSIGVATIIASGNSGFSDAISAPACISTAVSVGSVTKGDEVSTFSNTSSFLSLVAPGGDGTAGGGIRSAVVNAVTGVKSGTSMAAPHVAGAWAVLKSAAPAATVAQVLEALRTTGTAVVDPLNRLTLPRINVNAARVALVGSAGVLPGQPGRPTVSGGGLITISWTAPASGPAPSAYILRGGTNAGGSQLGIHNVGLATSVGPVPLPPGRYFVAVTAQFGTTSGPESQEVEFTVGTVPAVPGAPGRPVVTIAASGVTIAWSAPAAGPAPTHYVIGAGRSPGGTELGMHNVGGATSIATTLPAGTYYIRVFAGNAGGMGPPSAELSFAVSGGGLRATPGRPGLPSAAVRGSIAMIEWAPPASGLPPSHYVIDAGSASGRTDLGRHNVGPGTSISVTLAPGTYYIRVIAVNAAGESQPSLERSITVRASPPPNDGTWNGFTAQHSVLGFEIVDNRVIIVLAGARVGSCVVHRQVPRLAAPVENGAFTAIASSGDVVFTLSGRITGSTAAGSLTMASALAGACGGSVTTSWTAANSGIDADFLPGDLLLFRATVQNDRSVQFEWSPASFFGGPIVAYQVEVGTTPGGVEAGVFATAVAMYRTAPLPPGAYFARVRARNVSGIGPASSEASFTLR